MAQSEEALAKYSLDDRTTGASKFIVSNAGIRDTKPDHREYALSVSSTDDMTGDLKATFARKGWIVVTAWIPHCKNRPARVIFWVTGEL